MASWITLKPADGTSNLGLGLACNSPDLKVNGTELCSDMVRDYPGIRRIQLNILSLGGGAASHLPTTRFTLLGRSVGTETTTQYATANLATQLLDLVRADAVVNSAHVGTSPSVVEEREPPPRQGEPGQRPLPPPGLSSRAGCGRSRRYDLVPSGHGKMNCGAPHGRAPAPGQDGLAERSARGEAARAGDARRESKATWIG
jgi:pimeloyl-ACP methyl ester carboxylesterase